MVFASLYRNFWNKSCLLVCTLDVHVVIITSPMCTLSTTCRLLAWYCIQREHVKCTSHQVETSIVADHSLLIFSLAYLKVME